MGDASEAFDEIMTQIGKFINSTVKTQKSKGDFKNVVGFELFKRYRCLCKKLHDFPLDPNQFMLYAQVSHLTADIKTDYYDV